MTKTPTAENIAELTELWVSLQRVAPLKPIENAEDFARVGALGDLLAETVGGDSNHPLYTLFQLVMTLIEQWEDLHVHLPEAEPSDVLLCLLEANDLTPADLADLASPELLDDILSGQRNIDESLAKSLAKRFHIDVSAFR